MILLARIPLFLNEFSCRWTLQQLRTKIAESRNSYVETKFCQFIHGSKTIQFVRFNWSLLY